MTTPPGTSRLPFPATFEQRARVRFDGETDPDGVPWSAWAPSTAKVRARQGCTPPTNVLQLHNPGLRNSITSAVSAQGAIVTAGADYADYHEQIDGPEKGIIPRRAALFRLGISAQS
ncbi:phage virion morphogenesis protein [Paraburkholderia elongata]|uniref:Uncharacterized protein n=1 Tax=Paraburkholderia elongata TaxID=2675747 RepID=A0A972SKG3_9BURK|nr:hypothetical protein [Paraburkholderia elongata]